MTRNADRRCYPGFAVRCFLLGVIAVLPWIGLSVYEYAFGALSQEGMQLFIYVFGLFTAFMLLLLWVKIGAQFNSLANMVRGIRHGDFTQRARSSGSGGDSVETLKDEVNLLADALQENRLAMMEEDFLLQRLIDKLEIAVLILDDNNMLSMANPAFERLLGKSVPEMMGQPVPEIGPGPRIGRDSESTRWINFPKCGSRYMIHRTEFRQGGRVHHLVLLTDLKNPLREEERNAWKRLIRVLGHELNNSLTPIISLTQSLKGRVSQSGMAEDKARSFGEALDVIASRAGHLNNFMLDYSRLAKLPEPSREPVLIDVLVNRVSGLEWGSRIHVEPGPECRMNVDPAQVEQLLINIVKNAVEASGPDGGAVAISWKRESAEVSIWVDDDGPGVADNENLFVPFFSTKKGGSGIGLVLCREIAEANGGSINLSNRHEGGCRATIVLPLSVSD